MFDSISITHAHSDAMSRKHFIPAIRHMRRLPRWAVQVSLRENRKSTT
jgi:hypothetical protein